MSDLPYLPLWVSDYEAKTAHLSFEEDGAYSRLLRLAWTCPGGTLPHDDAWLMRRLRATEEFYDRVVRPVLKEFFSVRRGRYVNDRLKHEFDTALEKTLRRKAAGKTGGEAKARKTKEKPPSNATVLLEQSSSKSEPKPELEPEVVSRVVFARGELSEVSEASLDELEASCRKWANGSLADRAGPLILGPIIRLLKPTGGEPCTMDDVRNGITKAAASLHKRGEKVGLSYFEKPIIAARDLRLTPLPAPELAHETAVNGRSAGARAGANGAHSHGSGPSSARSGYEPRSGNLASAAARLRAMREDAVVVSDEPEDWGNDGMAGGGDGHRTYAVR
jgi:uncharacterized protein YdaU (DUF1376 family)